MSAKVRPSPGTALLTVAAWLSFVAALLHLAVIAGGGDWYRFFGAGEEFALAAERGEIYPHIVTLFIAAVLFLWGLIALSGAGRLRRLPLLRFCLVGISLVFLLRGLGLIPLWIIAPKMVDSFAIWSSLIVLIYGIAYAAGTWRAWPALRPAAAR